VSSKRSDRLDASRHLSPIQFGEDDGLDGPLGSYGEPGGMMMQGFEGVNTAMGQ
jgi:hypothetical protein